MHFSGILSLSIALLVGRSIAAPITVDQDNEIFARNPPRAVGSLGQVVHALNTAKRIDHAFQPKRDEAVFWAGRRPGPHGEQLSLEHDAHRIAQKHGKSTLEDTLHRHKITIPPAHENPNSKHLWDHASKTYAERAHGTTHAYLGTHIRPQSVYTNEEKPILMNSDRITRLTEHDVHHGTSRVVKGHGVYGSIGHGSSNHGSHGSGSGRRY
ncbi:hypothetical protein BJ912DRAFT_110919 [Pholiota molesta]|nr:hypothetical protein BJ912DRAFT_110919 [Pholiota molesta]